MPEIKDENFLLSELLEKKNGEPLYSLFIGAGCSISSGVPSSSEIIFQLKSKAYTNNSSSRNRNKYLKEQISKFKNILETDFSEKFLELVPLNLKSAAQADMNLYIDYLYQMLEYGFWFNEAYRLPFQRWQFIENIMDKIDPSVHYLFLAEAILNGLTRNVFTTNFDNLLSTSLIKYFNCTPRVYQLEYEIKELIKTNTNRPSIIKLHGDFLYRQHHTPSETTQLINFHSLFESEIKHKGLLIIGYSGMDNSIMNVIENVKIENNASDQLPLIWCDVVEYKDLTWRVKNLLENSHNSYYVKIKSFADISFKLWALFTTKIPSFLEPAYSKQNEVKYTLLNHFSNKKEFNHGYIKSKMLKIEKSIKENYDLFFLDKLDYPFNKEKVEQEITEVEKEILLSDNEAELKKLEYRKALLIKRTKNFIESERLFIKLIKKHPFFEEAYLSLAHIYILRYREFDTKKSKIGENFIKKAIKYLKLSIELNRFNFIAHFLIANSYFGINDLEMSFYHYCESNKLNPLYPGAIEGMAFIYYKNGNHAEAIKLYNKILKNNANNFKVCLRAIEVIIDQSIISKAPITGNKFLRLYYNCLINSSEDIYTNYKNDIWVILNKLNDYLEIDSSPRIKAFVQDHLIIVPFEDSHYIHKLLGRISFLTSLRQSNPIDRIYFLRKAEEGFIAALKNKRYFSPTYQKHLANTYFELYKVVSEEKYKQLAEKTFSYGYEKICKAKNNKNEPYNSPQFLIDYSFFLDYIGEEVKKNEVLKMGDIHLKNILKKKKNRKRVIDSVKKVEVDYKLLSKKNK